MNDNKTNAEKTNPAEKPKFPLDRLRRDCLKLFGVTTSTFDGATFKLNGNFTVEDIKEKIDKWQKKKIKFKESKEQKGGK